MSWFRTELGRAVVAALACVALVYAFPVGRRDDVPGGGAVVALLIVLALVGIAALVRSLVRRHLAGADIKLGALSLVVSLAVATFALGYLMLENRDPTQFEGLGTRTDALYFTVTVLATVGFGDIAATGQLARFLVTLQMVFNVVVIATAAGILRAEMQRRERGRS